MDPSRRVLLIGGSLTGVATAAFGFSLFGTRRKEAAAATTAASASTTPGGLYTDEEWQKRLTRNQYAVLRREATERPYSSPLNDEHRAGTFVCAGCEQELFSSKTKFDSGTGWPSFYQALNKNSVGERVDNSLQPARVEVHCGRCGGHLGHVFNDGPAPTGLRYCMNGVAMNFVPAST